MEKIYMEDNNSKQTKKGLVDFSVVLSFTVAVFAIFSIAMFGIVSFQGTNVSYAAPLTDTSEFQFSYGIHDGSDSKVTIKAEVPGDNSKSIIVPIYLAGSNTNYNNPVFCVEHNVNAPRDGTTVRKTEEITDYGLLYLLNNSYANGHPQTSITNEVNKKYVEAYITQVAIWVYMYETQSEVVKNGVSGIYNSVVDDVPDATDTEGKPSNPTDNVKIHLITTKELTAIKSATALTNLADQDALTSTIYEGENIYTKYIRPLVDRAKTVSAQKTLSISYAEGSASRTTDGKFYQTPLVSATGTPDEDFISYDIALSGVDGAFLVDEDGKELAMTGIPKGKRFYVRVPAEKIPEGKQVNIQITGTGHFNGVTGSYFLAESNGNALQKIVTVTGVTRQANDSDVISIVGGPDTGMNSAQTIYFIGLIVLLCGVGIVYANAKPVEIKQQ